MSDECYIGDVRNGLRAMIATGIRAQTCVTSPPYWGLRDYGVPGQIGLEPTIGEYVQTMVEVFRLVRDVLADDGTVFLNLGDAYWGGGRGGGAENSKQRTNVGSLSSVPASRLGAQSNGSACKARSGLTATDSAYPCLCDECAAVLFRHNAGSSRPTHAGDEQLSPTGRDSEHSDSRIALPGASPLVVPASTMSGSCEQPQALCSHCDNCGVCLSVLRSSTRDAALCARRARYTIDNAGPASESRNLGMDASGMAWLNYEPKPKDLLGLPWRVAFALQADGWYLRQDIIWSKPNPMPESVTDRCTKSHEYLFLLSKRERYYYDADAIAEPANSADRPQPNPADKTISPNNTAWLDNCYAPGASGDGVGANGSRNRRSVWTVTTQPYADAHFATFPPKLIKPCILAGSRPGDVVLDPFMGSGTVAQVAQSLGRRWIGCELNPAYVEMQKRRAAQLGMALA